MHSMHPIWLALLLALLMGVVAGMRSFLPLAVLGVALWRRPELTPPATPAEWFVLWPLALIFVLLTLAELVGDKLPRTPNRTALGPFTGRLITGALSGAVIAQVMHTTGWGGALAGAVGAGASAIIMFRARRRVGLALKVRDPYVGAAEDVIAIVGTVVVVMVMLGRA